MESNGATTCTGWGVDGIQRHHHLYRVGGRWNPTASPLVPGGGSVESNGITTRTGFWGGGSMESNGTTTCTRWGSMESNGITTCTGWGVDGIQRHHHLYRVGGRWNPTASLLVPASGGGGGGSMESNGTTTCTRWGSMESNGITTCTGSGVDEIQRHHYWYRLVVGGVDGVQRHHHLYQVGVGNPTESPLVPGVGSMECNVTTTCTGWGVYGIQRHHHSYQVGGPFNPTAPPLVPGGVSMESNGTTTCTRWGSVESNGITTCTGSGVDEIQRHHYSYRLVWGGGGGRWNPTAPPLESSVESMESNGTTT